MTLFDGSMTRKLESNPMLKLGSKPPSMPIMGSESPDTLPMMILLLLMSQDLVQQQVLMFKLTILSQPALHYRYSEWGALFYH